MSSCSAQIGNGVVPRLATPGPNNVDEAVERKLGAREHPRILAAFGGAYDDAKLQAGLQQLTTKLVHTSPRPDLKYRITVLNSPSVNAFALPGGYVYVTRGLLALVNDYDELAAVLAHEMAHISSHHAAARANQAQSAVNLGHVVLDLTGRPESMRKALYDHQQNLASFSRSQELEADRIGVETAVKAGFDPYGAASFLERMQRHGNLMRRRYFREEVIPSDQSQFLATHPTAASRVALVRQAAKRLGFRAGQRPRKKSAYLRLIDGLPYGDDPSQGLVNGQDFVHPKLRFRFRAPKSLALYNRREAVYGFGRHDLAMRFDGVRLSRQQKLEKYLVESWGKGLNVTDITATRINGRDAVIGHGHHQGWHYRLAALRFGKDRVYRFLFVAHADDPRLDRYPGAMLDSFTRISPAQARNIRPRRIKIRSVKPGQRLAPIAAATAFAEPKLDGLRVLNGLAKNQSKSPKNGLLKLVINP